MGGPATAEVRPWWAGPDFARAQRCLQGASDLLILTGNGLEAYPINPDAIAMGAVSAAAAWSLLERTRVQHTELTGVKTSWEGREHPGRMAYGALGSLIGSRCTVFATVNYTSPPVALMCGAGAAEPTAVWRLHGRVDQARCTRCSCTTELTDAEPLPHLPAAMLPATRLATIHVDSPARCLTMLDPYNALYHDADCEVAAVGGRALTSVWAEGEDRARLLDCLQRAPRTPSTALLVAGYKGRRGDDEELVEAVLNAAEDGLQVVYALLPRSGPAALDDASGYYLGHVLRNLARERGTVSVVVNPQPLGATDPLQLAAEARLRYAQLFTALGSPPP